MGALQNVGFVLLCAASVVCDGTASHHAYGRILASRDGVRAPVATRFELPTPPFPDVVYDADRHKRVATLIDDSLISLLPKDLTRIIAAYDEPPPTPIPYLNLIEGPYARRAPPVDMIECFTIRPGGTSPHSVTIGATTLPGRQAVSPLEDALVLYRTHLFPDISPEVAYPHWKHFLESRNPHSGVPREVSGEITNKSIRMTRHLLADCTIKAVLRTSRPARLGARKSLLWTAPGMTVQRFVVGLRDTVAHLTKIHDAHRVQDSETTSSPERPQDASWPAMAQEEIPKLLEYANEYLPVLELIANDPTESLVPIFYPRTRTLHSCVLLGQQSQPILSEPTLPSLPRRIKRRRVC